MQNINRVVLTGNLTRDPELKTTNSGLAICKLRVACNSRVKRNNEWVDSPNYFDVTVFGGQGESVAKYLAKGRALAIDGRLEWSEWEKDGDKRQSVQIIADSVQFLGGNETGGGDSSSVQAAPVDTSDFTAPATVSAADDDIPF